MDNAASAPIRDEVIEAILPVLRDDFANPSGSHSLARKALRLIDDARDDLAEVFGCHSQDIVFTSGGTESDNLAIFGVHSALGGSVICSATEHHAVLEPTKSLGGKLIDVDRYAALDLDHLSETIEEDTTLVSVGLVNGETGIIQDLETIAEIIKEKSPNALIHTDAVQAVPWLDIPKLTANIDLISVAAHKFGGPKGVGALVVKDQTKNGMKEDEIYSFLSEKYGDWILYKPPLKNKSYILWALPYIFFIIGAFIIFFILKKTIKIRKY